jgi:hypothetical protein
MTTKIFEYYLTQLIRKLGAKNHRILLLIEQFAAHPNNTKVIFLPAYYTTQAQHLYLGNIHGFRCHYRMQLIQKTAAMIGGDCSKMLHRCVVCNAFNSRTFEVGNTH